MKFNPTQIKDVFFINLEKNEDERGFLARTWGTKEFLAYGLDFNLVEGYVTSTKSKGTIRGFHYLKVNEKKLTRVLRGSVFEVVIDVRPDSPTFKKWQAFTFKRDDYKMLYMGPGIAHAILTLEDNTELMSLYSPAYAPRNEKGIRFDDPSFNVAWPAKITSVSEKDTAWEDFK